MNPSLRLAAAFAAILALPSPAAAQESDGWILSLGAGARAQPKYPGADSIGIGPMGILDLRRVGSPLPFEAPDEGWGFGFLSDESRIDFGPSLRFQTKREEEDVGAAVGEVGFTVEAGGFVHAFLADNVRLRAEGRRGLGGHKGWVGDLSADFVLRDRDTYVFSIGPRARIADDRYHDSYFGVTPAVAAATGLAPYDPGGGFYALGATAGLTYMLSRDWGLYGYAGYDRLIGDAADSPIVRTYGSRNQYSAGLGLFYNFRVGQLLD